VQPLVGIPLCLDDRGRFRAGRTYHYVHAAYARAVEQAGGVPVYLPGQSDVGALVGRIDALLVPGGDDLPPPRPYPPEIRFDLVPEAQLAFDRALLDAALARGLPVLGICYGMQLLAYRAGGSFVYDIPSDRPAAGAHRLPEPGGRHPVTLEPGSRLAALVGLTSLAVNSSHHQAVAEPGHGLRVVARAADGIVEAIESTDPTRFVLGVQWHPERMDHEHRAALFGALLGVRPECG
jgi:putative glutamine amidotransferase